MDKHQCDAVTQAFIELFQQHLIYRDLALVNWCCKLRSTISDIEIEQMPIEQPTQIRIPDYNNPVTFGFMTSFAYKVDDGNEEIVVSTTRPETMLGDVAVAVHPRDSRYRHIHNRRLIHPLRNETIPVIVDEFVDMNFGTGAVKITPAHDKIDYEVGKRHNLQLIQVINEEGNIMDQFSNYAGVKRFDCRELICDRLNNLGLLRDEKPHSMSLPLCSRTGDVIEFLPKEQWFVSCKELSRKASDVVREGKLKIEPEDFVKNWLRWSDDQRNWCISRQLWWGHRIPAYKCRKLTSESNEGKWFACKNENEAMAKAALHYKCPQSELSCEQDTDVLDTWFSSGIYPFSSLGWPDTTPDVQKFYPLSIMITGHDILGFWVHKMVMLGLQLTGKLPFNQILLHSVICDSKGAKMSKSKGNVIDPEDIINGRSLNELNAKSKSMMDDGVISKDEYKKSLQYYKSNFPEGIPECGVDALRFTLCSKNIKNYHMTLDIQECHANKLFGNKLWQCVKYAQKSISESNSFEAAFNKEELSPFDKWILSRLSFLVANANESFENNDFHTVTRSLKSFLYNEVCDVYLEATKPAYKNLNESMYIGHSHTLTAILNVGLRCLSPFMIYLPETLIPSIPILKNNCIYQCNETNNNRYVYPKTEDWNRWRDVKLEDTVDSFLKIASTVRFLKSLCDLPGSVRPIVYLDFESSDLEQFVNDNGLIFQFLSRTSEVITNSEVKTNEQLVFGLADDTMIALVIPNAENRTKIINNAKEKLEKKIAKLKKMVNQIEQKISDEKRTPEWLLEIISNKLSNLNEEIRKYEEIVGYLDRGYKSNRGTKATEN